MNAPPDDKPAAADIPPEEINPAPDGSAKSDDPDRSPPRDACDTGGFSSAGQRQVLTADRK